MLPGGAAERVPAGAPVDVVGQLDRRVAEVVLPEPRLAPALASDAGVGAAERVEGFVRLARSRMIQGIAPRSVLQAPDDAALRTKRAATLWLAGATQLGRGLGKPLLYPLSYGGSGGG